MSTDPVPTVPCTSTEPPSRNVGTGLAIASMVLGILSFAFCGPLCSIPAVILGHFSLNKIRRGLMPSDARGFALAGTILGWVNIALFSLWLIIFVLFVVLSSGAGHISPFVYKM